MLAYIVRRILITIPVILIVAVFAFAIVHLTPGDPIFALAGPEATDSDRARLRVELGLDRSIVVQFLAWFLRILQGDLGRSLYSGQPLSILIMQRLEPTVSLTIVTLLIAVAVGIPLGVVSAWRAGTWIDRLCTSVSVVGFSLPVFVLGYILILLFAMALQWLPVQGYAPLSGGLWPWLRNLILPSLTLATTFIGIIARMTRTSVLEVLGEDFIRTAHAKGLSTSAVLFRHALRSAAVPIVTVIGTGLVGLLGGVVVTESVFGLPGLGRLTVEAVLSRDYPIIQGVIVVFTMTYLLINLAIDISYTFLDPRIRY